MDQFKLFLDLGFEHITDTDGYDHILFIIALCAIYTYKDWKGILWMVTAFTIGHSITLVLSTLGLIYMPRDLVDVFIPFTIFLTCAFNIFFKHDETQGFKKGARIKYFTALAFGLVHGMAFANDLRSILALQDSILLELFAFNVGLELGQIVIVIITLAAAFLVVNLGKLPKRYWNISLSSMAGVVALLMIFGVL